MLIHSALLFCHSATLTNGMPAIVIFMGHFYFYIYNDMAYVPNNNNPQCQDFELTYISESWKPLP